MKKIISLFQRNYETDHLVRDEIVPGAEWVLIGEGVATRKWDGTAMMVRGGKLYKRFDCKQGKQPPLGFEPCQEPDPVTGHWPGWVLVGAGPEDKLARETFALAPKSDGTYELCGPKINRNPEHLTVHSLIRHGNEQYPSCPRTFEGLKAMFAMTDIEGIVWHHSDGRMVKIKKKDFGFKR